MTGNSGDKTGAQRRTSGRETGDIQVVSINGCHQTRQSSYIFIQAVHTSEGSQLVMLVLSSAHGCQHLK